MSDEVETGEVVTQEIVSPTIAESAPVDADAIRAEIETNLRAEYDKKVKGLETGITAERHKRQELENKEPVDVDALIDQRFKEREQAAAEARENEKMQSLYATAKERLEGATELYGDVNPLEVASSVGEVLASVGEGRDFNKDLQLEIMSSDNAAHIFKHLSDNPEELSALANASPLVQGRKLAEIERGFKSGIKLTNAPSPIEPLTGGSSGVDDIYDLEGSEFETHLKANNGGSVFPKRR